MRALLTGGTGFVGRVLAEKLIDAGFDLHAIVRPGSDTSAMPDATLVHRHDGSAARMAAIAAAARPDVTFHLASLFRAEHKPDEITPMIEANLAFGTQLVDALTALGPTKLVNAGTAWQHFGGSAYDPVCLYAATKQAFEALLEFYVQARGLQAITLKIFETYGPGDPRPKLMNALVAAAKSGKPIDLTAGDQQLDFVHAADAADAFIAAASRLTAGQAAGHERYALSSGAPVSTRQLVSLVERLGGRPIRANWGARAYRKREVLVPWSGGAALPGWAPKIALDQGIAELLRVP
ncbi:MAG TPA: NAD(P)-dependent oxidoreductase [Candidatus Cybelea sp.]|nr:NAD(P)-dependent oxidoreductase [Candidatus Cybelea sp.]